MAQEFRQGFLVDTITGALIVTTVTTGATVQSGFLRDAQGRLVIA